MPGRLDFRNRPTLAPLVLLDASVILAAMVTSSRDKADAQAFLRYAASQSSTTNTILLASEIAIEECAFIITKGSLMDEAKTGKYQRLGITQAKQWSELYKAEPQLVRGPSFGIKRFLRDLQGIPIRTIEPSPIAATRVSIPQRMTEFMRNYQLLPSDAAQLAIASALAIQQVASLDRDWLHADSMFSVLTNRI